LHNHYVGGDGVNARISPSEPVRKVGFMHTFRLGRRVHALGMDVLRRCGLETEHHRKLWPTTDPIEHLNGEVRRRTGSVGMFPDHVSALRLIMMILIEQTEDCGAKRHS
jgi:putative transposase